MADIANLALVAAVCFVGYMISQAFIAEIAVSTVIQGGGAW